MRLSSLALAAVFACVTTGPAVAHSGDEASGFISGFSHPFAGADHMLAMIGVGLWGAILGRPLIVALPVLFPMAMAFGGVLAIAGLAAPPVELGIACSVLLIGSAIAAAYRAPIWLACGGVALFALLHGYAHGAELPASAEPLPYSAGFVLATGLLHMSGIAVGALTRWKSGLVAVRCAGGAVAAMGVWFVWNAVA